MGIVLKNNGLFYSGDMDSWRALLLNSLIKDGMGIEEKTLIRVAIFKLDYETLRKKVKTLI